MQNENKEQEQEVIRIPVCVYSATLKPHKEDMSRFPEFIEAVNNPPAAQMFVVVDVEGHHCWSPEFDASRGTKIVKVIEVGDNTTTNEFHPWLNLYEPDSKPGEWPDKSPK